jgi:hypothetical protein
MSTYYGDTHPEDDFETRAFQASNEMSDDRDLEDERVLNFCKLSQAEVAEHPEYTKQCLLGEGVYYVEYYKALLPGHIYSQAGVKEFGISRMCEYHFDEVCDKFGAEGLEEPE